MTVAELIRILQGLDGDMEVFLNDLECDASVDNMNENDLHVMDGQLLINKEGW